MFPLERLISVISVQERLNKFFRQVWNILSERQRETLAAELVPFICSGSHVLQKDCHPSALNTFVEAMAYCQPTVAVKPAILKYLGKSHNLWHRSALLLERIAFDSSSQANVLKVRKDSDQYEFEPHTPTLNLQHEAMDALSEMYSLLKEEDLWSGLWQKKAKYQETNIAIAYEQQGYFEQAQGAYELAMTKFRNDYNGQSSPVGVQQVTICFVTNIVWVAFL